MGFFKDFYDAWNNNYTLREQQEYNRQVEQGRQYHQALGQMLLEAILKEREKEKDSTPNARLSDSRAIKHEIENATIERCAQVVKRVAQRNVSDAASLSWNDAIATMEFECMDALRKLKEQP